MDADMSSMTTSAMPGMDTSTMDMSGMGSMDGMDDHSGHGDHSSMDMSMGMSMMQMTFFQSTTTPLYSIDWTPTSTGQYAGTCIFLIVLAFVLSFLLALKGVLEMYVWQSTIAPAAEVAAAGGKEDKSLAETVRMNTRPWRLSTDGTRAILDVVIVGIGYLLMLAVMTFNVGYFLSVLAGSFLGSLILGRYMVIGRGTH